MAKKVKTESVKKNVREPTFKTFYSRNNRPFRLSGITEQDAIILWLDTNKFETFAYETIKPYLK